MMASLHHGLCKLSSAVQENKRGKGGVPGLRAAEVRIREHPLAALCVCLTLFVLANVARTTLDGFGGIVLWAVLFLPSVMIGSVVLRVFWDRRRSR